MRAVAPAKCWPKTVTDPVVTRMVLEDSEIDAADPVAVGVGRGLDLGLVLGLGVADELGDVVGVGDVWEATTASAICTGHDPFQQIRMWWSPIPMSSGTAICALKLPLASALKGNVYSWLSRWISPPWFAGKPLAVTVSPSPG